RRDLAVVSVRIAGAERLGRLVRRMRLVEVKQEEERFALARLDPIESEPRGLPSRPLAAAEGLAGAQVDRRLEEVEALGEAGFATQDVARNRRSGRIAGGLEQARQEGM